MYNYEELKNAALSPDATGDDIFALGAGFEQYGYGFWNGEYYDVEGERLFPIWQWDEEADQGVIVGYYFD